MVRPLLDAHRVRARGPVNRPMPMLVGGGVYGWVHMLRREAAAKEHSDAPAVT